MLYKIVLISLAVICTSSTWYSRENIKDWYSREGVTNLYNTIKEDIKKQGNADIGKEESEQLMVHNIQGLLLAQNYSLPVAAEKYGVSEMFLSKIMETKPFPTNDYSVVDDNPAIFNLTGFDCSDCNEDLPRTITNLTGTPTNSSLMDFTFWGLTVKQSGFFLLMPINTWERQALFQVMVPSPNVNSWEGLDLEGTHITIVWLNKGDTISFKATTAGISQLKGFQIRVQKI